MAIKLPERNYFTLHELMKRWECEENDIRSLIVAGDLKPSCVINHVATPVTLVAFEDDGHQYWEAQQVENDAVYDNEEDGEECKYKLVTTSGFYYYLLPYRTGPFDCRFVYFSKDRDYTPGSDTPCLMISGRSKEWNYFTELNDVLERGAFLMEEIARFETLSQQSGPPLMVEKPLSTRERHTLLTIIAVLCKEAKIDYTKPAKAAGLIQSTAAFLPVSIGESTIEGHLKKIPDALETRMK